MDGTPYFQRATKTHAGCQIDYLIQTKFGTLYICEIKVSKEPIGVSVIKEMEQKIRRLKKPKSCSVRPVLIYVGDVTDELLESDFFAHTIDFGKMLI